MVDEKIDLIFEAIDRASNNINAISDRLNRLDSNVASIPGKFVGLQIAADLAFNALNAGLDLAASGIDFFISRLDIASQKQTEAIGTAASLGAVFGTSFQESSDILEVINQQVKEVVDVLPGATADYQKIATSIADNLEAIAETNGVLDIERLAGFATDISKAYRLLAPDIDPNEIVKTLSRALSGAATLSELGNLQLFENNQALFGQIKEAVLERGVKELRELDAVTRAEIIREVGLRFATSDVIDAYADSFEGTVESFRSVFNNIFDFNRKLSGRNNESVLNAATETLNALFGILDKIGQGLGLAGFDQDTILETVYDVLQQLTDLFNRIADSINPQDIENFFNGLSLNQKMFFLGEKTGELIAGAINNIDPAWIQTFLDQINSALNSFVIGLAVSFLDNIIPATANMAAKAAEAFIQSVFDAIVNFAQTIGNAFAEVLGGQAQRVTPEIEAQLNSQIATPALSQGAAETPAQYAGQIPARYTGQIPALRDEAVYAPGTKPVIANSSEYILTPEQMQAILRGARDTGSGSTYNINLSGIVGNKEELGRYLTDLLDKRYKNFNQANYT